MRPLSCWLPAWLLASVAEAKAPPVFSVLQAAEPDEMLLSAIQCPRGSYDARAAEHRAALLATRQSALDAGWPALPNARGRHYLMNHSSFMTVDGRDLTRGDEFLSFLLPHLPPLLNAVGRTLAAPVLEEFVDLGPYQKQPLASYCSDGMPRPPVCAYDDAELAAADAPVSFELSQVPLWLGGGAPREIEVMYTPPPSHLGVLANGHILANIVNFKVGSTSMLEFYNCEQLVRSPSDLRNRMARGANVTSFMVVRDPVRRFTSAVREMLVRHLYDDCLGLPCRASPFFYSSPQRAHDRSVASATFLRTLYSPGFNISRRSDLVRVVSDFVDDIACCREFTWQPHFSSQVTFAAFAGEAGLDHAIELEQLDEKLPELLSELGHDARCDVPHGNVQSNRPESSRHELSDDSLMTVLRADDNRLLRRVCRTYLEDYTCFDAFTLPPECADIAALEKLSW